MWVLIIGQWFLYSTPASLELHKSLVIAGRAPEIQRLISLCAAPGDRFQAQQIVGSQLQIIFVRGSVCVMEPGTRCENDDACNWIPFIFGEQKSHRSACRKCVPEREEVIARLRRHSVFLAARFQMEPIVDIHIFTLLGCAYLYYVVMGFFDLLLYWLT